MPVDYAALKNEIDTDPATIGYAPLVTSGDDVGIANLLNQVRAGTSITKAFIPLEDVLAAIVKTEFDSLTSAQKTVVDQFIRGTRIKSGDANMRATLGALFAAGTTTRANLVALSTRTGSRAEVLFGEGIVIGHADVARALRG